ncbi:hypothetical protein ACFWTE_01720 [Nocardiopsis sp. NPDC058631]|uniref:hypothetical protein n=1 Tax=Nocardiopsis sp. NPDC058631 TaxID=3346566 RepID=UPI00365F02AD
MTEANEDGPRTEPREPLSNWVPLGLAAAAVAVLVGGWPLVNALLPGSESVPSGEPVPVGAGGDYRASLTFPQDGWLLDTGASQAGQTYRFDRGPVQLTLISVTPVTEPPPTAEQLWDGMRKIARAGEASAQLSAPEAISTEEGAEGLTGTLTSDSQQGAAVVYPSPDGGFAVEMTLAGQDATTADLAAVADVVRSVSFTQGGAA